MSRSDGMYGISRKVNPLQKMFSGHVLRDLDIKILNIEALDENHICDGGDNNDI